MNIKVLEIIKNTGQCLRHYYLRLKFFILSPLYQSIILPNKIKSVRKKERITVLFVLSELGAWKTELLYNSMLSHPRFNVKLLIVPAKETPEGVKVIKQYLTKKGYCFDEVIERDEKLKDKFKADIIFYQKPYDNVIDERYFYLNHLDSVFCYVLYSFRNRNYPNIRNIDFVRFIWQFYAENQKVIDESVPVFSTKAKNYVNTGIPIMDELLLEKEHFKDPWKNCGKKKRIIYAPHHTVFSDIYEYATFLDYCDFMLEMVEKYKDKVQWAFKPHPVLKGKLYTVWGKERTDNYYRKWEELENCQLSSGEYLDLFKHSDAMIHDCGSFKIEYLYTNNPVMFLLKTNPVNDYSNWQTLESLELHYKGYSKEDIEGFILDVINGNDELKNKRESFVQSYLVPPYGKTACENIINAILGHEEYSN